MTEYAMLEPDTTTPAKRTFFGVDPSAYAHKISSTEKPSVSGAGGGEGGGSGGADGAGGGEVEAAMEVVNTTMPIKKKN